MTNADNMFYSLGYEKADIEPYYITYRKVYDTHTARIIFKLKEKLVDLTLDFDNSFKTNSMGCCLNAEKVKAINEKVKELKWYD